jgi:hypothetical protein
MSEYPEQDLGVQKPAVPDQNWARTQPMNIIPSQHRLSQPHQLVSIRNTSDTTVTAAGRPQPQRHIVIDRYNQGHELEPGETKHDIDMLVSEIQHFMDNRKPDRKGRNGFPRALHPIKILGFDEKHTEEPRQAKKA